MDMREAMDIAEALDTVVPWQWRRRSPIEWEAMFEIEGTEYEASIFCGSRTHSIWTLNFGARPEGEDDFTQQKTGTGNGRVVYATVLEIFLAFERAKLGEVKGFEIESDVTERNRHSLNVLFAKRFASRAEGEYAIEDRGDTVILRRV